MASRSSILRLMNASRHVACPCHACSSGASTFLPVATQMARKYAQAVPEKEYAFEVAAANLRFGEVSIILDTSLVSHLVELSCGSVRV